MWRVSHYWDISKFPLPCVVDVTTLEWRVTPVFQMFSEDEIEEYKQLFAKLKIEEGEQLPILEFFYQIGSLVYIANA